MKGVNKNTIINKINKMRKLRKRVIDNQTEIEIILITLWVLILL